MPERPCGGPQKVRPCVRSSSFDYRDSCLGIAVTFTTALALSEVHGIQVDCNNMSSAQFHVHRLGQKIWRRREPARPFLEPARPFLKSSTDAFRRRIDAFRHVKMQHSASALSGGHGLAGGWSAKGGTPALPVAQVFGRFPSTVTSRGHDPRCPLKRRPRRCQRQGRVCAKSRHSPAAWATGQPTQERRLPQAPQMTGRERRLSGSSFGSG